MTRAWRWPDDIPHGTNIHFKPRAQGGDMSDERQDARPEGPARLGSVPYDDSAEFWRAVYLMAAGSKLFDGCDPALVADDAVEEYRARFPVERSPNDFADVSDGLRKHLFGANVADTIKVGGGDVTTKTPGYPCEVHYYGDEPLHGDVYRFETPEQYEAWRKEKFGTP